MRQLLLYKDYTGGPWRFPLHWAELWFQNRNAWQGKEHVLCGFYLAKGSPTPRRCKWFSFIGGHSEASDLSLDGVGIIGMEFWTRKVKTLGSWEKQQSGPQRVLVASGQNSLERASRNMSHIWHQFFGTWEHRSLLYRSKRKMSLVTEDIVIWIFLALQVYPEGTKVSRKHPQKFWCLQQSMHSSKQLSMHQSSPL